MSDDSSAGQRYRLVVEGELAVERAGWFGAALLSAEGGLTTMLLLPADEPDLHGMLRRVRDLNLRIVELTRLGDGE